MDTATESAPVRKFKMTGNYACQSGKEYWYFLFCSPHPNTMVEAWLYHEGKKFTYDDVFNSPDLLAKFTFGPERLLDLPMGDELTKQLATYAIQQEIERWDAARPQEQAVSTRAPKR
jgi:hypothetical protein